MYPCGLRTKKEYNTITIPAESSLPYYFHGALNDESIRGLSLWALSSNEE